MEQEGRVSAGVARSQNAVYVMPHAWTSIAQALGPLLERVDDASRDLQLLIVTADAEVAAAAAAASVKLTTGRDIGIVAATSARRAARLIRIKPPQVLAGSPDTLVDLMKGASIKLESVRMVSIAWVDELLARGGGPALETIMAEVPKDASRTVVTAELSPAVDEILERYARRAPRVASAADEGQPVSVDYVTVSPGSRLSVLRRLLDETDPQSAVVFARDGDSEMEVRDLLRALGYSGSDAAIRVGLTAPPGTELVVLFDLPASREELREAVSAATRSVALVQPRQLGSLRTLAAGGALKPLVLTDSGSRARDREARMRDELRSTLRAGQFGRELLALEPLLDDYDGIEIAAAALQLLDRERADRAAAPVAAPSAARPREAGAMVPLFVNVGSRDGARPGDIVGAIASQPGLTGGDVGKVDVRESHTVVEVAAGVADAVIERLTGSAIRGRRAIARRDEMRRKPPVRDGGRSKSSRPPSRPRRDD